jgi:hypothetical protein
VCTTLHAGLAQATPEQQRALVELLIDCVVVSDADVGICYTLALLAISTS